MILDTDNGSFYSAERHGSGPRRDGEHTCLVRPKGSFEAALIAMRMKFITRYNYSSEGDWNARIAGGGWIREHSWEVVVWFEEHS